MNSLLDRRLFVSNIVNILQEINNHVDSLPKTLSRVLDFFCTVFEFTVGGIIVKSDKFGHEAIITHKNTDEHITDEFKNYIRDYAVAQCSINLHSDHKWESKTFEGINVRNFPKSDALKSKYSWKLTSRGSELGVIAMGSTATIKFDQEGQEILKSFISHVAIVLDNAMLVNNLEKSNTNLSEVIHELKETQSQLIQSEKMASLGQLMAGLVHEMNNPLTFVSANFEHIQLYVKNYEKLIAASLKKFEPDIPEIIGDVLKEIGYEFIHVDFKSALNDMDEGLNRALRIISDLRTFSAQDRGDMIDSDLTQIVESTINILRHQLQDNTKIIREFAEIPSLICNSGQIGQVVLNLLSNAIFAVKEIESAEITLKLNTDDNNIVFEMIDNGTGISEHNIDKLFQPFFTTKKIGEGMGLGLSITHGIIQRHNGSISVDSEVGKGTHFRVSLPTQIPHY